MECPECQHENREDAKFCSECGHKFELTCPDCGTANRPGAKFCDECGHNLDFPSEQAPKELSFAEKIAKIQKFLPKGLTEKILAQRDKIEGERKLVTVMFCDMEGFTPLVEKLGPEEAYSIMDQVYEILIHKVHDYEGTVNEMSGDGIMALFGAPIALEDSPQKAIRSAYSIHREIAKFNDKMKHKKESKPPLRMRIGIHSGPVVVGTLGNDLRLEFKAVGDTVNLASRMEGLAEPGATFVSEETFKLTEGFFRFEALGKKEVKGKKEPVSVYRAVVPSSRRTRFDVSAERGLTPFVGRERELEILLDAFERAKAGRGQAISIMSEAGVGKSRLLYEFRKAVANEDATFLEGKCLSYSSNIAYHPVIDILKSNFNIQEGDGDSEISEEVKKGLKVLGADEATTLPYILELLSVRNSGIDKIMMSPGARGHRILEALRRIVLRGSEIRPLILAIEDLHWIDKSSEEALKDLIDYISGFPILIIYTYRSEYIPPWGGKSYYSQVTLNRLSYRESLRTASYLLGTDEIDLDLRNLILEKTEGVPFFVEEFIKSLKDLQLIEKTDNRYHLSSKAASVSIPSTIQDVIMARVDALPGWAKEVLQAGSAIEREFSYSLIRSVTDLPEQDLLSNLSILKDTEVLYERGILPQSTFIFKHALTREVVYDSLLEIKKKSLHQKIGKVMEELYKDDLIDHYEALAHHFFLSEEYEKAAEYSKLAARKAEKAASFFKAISHKQQRIACLEKLPLTEDVQRKIIDARTGLGLNFLQMNQNQAKKAIDPIMDSAIKLDYKKRLCQIYAIVGVHDFVVREDIQDACKALEHSLELSQEAGDIVTSILATYYYAGALAADCEFERAAHYFERACEINLLAGSLWGASAMLSSLAYGCLGPQGKVDQAFQASQRAIELAEKSGDVFSKGTAYVFHGVSCRYKGFFQEAETHFSKGFEFAQFMPLYWYGAAQIDLGDLFFSIGHFLQSKESYEKGISVLNENKLQPSILTWGNLGLWRTKIMLNEKDLDLEYLRLVQRMPKIKNLEGPCLNRIGDILLSIDDHHVPEAEQCICEAIEMNKRNGTILSLAWAHASYSELFRRKLDRLGAQEQLGKAIEVMKKCGAEGWVKKYEEELASLS